MWLLYLTLVRIPTVQSFCLRQSCQLYGSVVCPSLGWVSSRTWRRQSTRITDGFGKSSKLRAKQNKEAAPLDDSTVSTDLKGLMHSAVQELQAAGVDEAQESVFHVLSVVLGLSWETGYRQLRALYQKPLVAHNKQGNDDDDPLLYQSLTLDQLSHFDSLMERRKAHEPIQYLVGKWDFLDYTFAVRAPLLCPRPETEELVLYVAERLKQQPRDEADSTFKPRILDVGSGTGCIGISLADMIPNATVTALDVEPAAIETAQQNALAILGPEGAKYRYQVLLQSADEYALKSDDDPFDLVVSNPPYIPARDMDSLDSVVAEWESHTALCGGEDGMDVIRTIIRALPNWCRSGAECWMEVDPTHPTLIQAWLEQEGKMLGVSFLETRKDLQGFDRFVRLLVMLE